MEDPAVQVCAKAGSREHTQAGAHKEMAARVEENVAVSATVTVTSEEVGWQLGQQAEAVTAFPAEIVVQVEKERREAQDLSQAKADRVLRIRWVVRPGWLRLHCKLVLPLHSHFQTIFDCPSSLSVSAAVSDLEEHRAAAYVPRHRLFLSPWCPQSWGRHCEPQARSTALAEPATEAACPPHSLSISDACCPHARERDFPD